jgi:hypothetical protein
MIVYRHRQEGTRLVWFLVTLAVIAAVSGFRQTEAPRWIYGVVFAILLGSALVFASLTVEIVDGHLQIAYGPGWVRRTWPLAEIQEVRAVTNPWYYGWGIHLTPHGWLYNVAGREAVEIRFHDGRSVRVGTDEPDRLAGAIRQTIGRQGG